MSNPMLGGAPRMNPMQMLQQLRSNPMQFIQRAGFRVPQNLSDPNAIITVPRGCCFNVAVENTSGPAAVGGVAPEILVQNANLTVARIA